MSKMKRLITTALSLCAVLTMALPAHALEYNINAPGDQEYGKPTSFEPVVTADGGAMKNEDLSKSAALIPPGFGTPTSYMLNTGEHLTPNLVPSRRSRDRRPSHCGHQHLHLPHHVRGLHRGHQRPLLQRRQPGHPEDSLHRPDRGRL